MPDPLNKIPYKQDMPPKGGYQSITYKRLATYSPKSAAILAGIALLVPIGFWDYKTKRHRNTQNLLEDDEGRTALEPLMQAEQDRILLWQMRRNREEENELMKNVPGWVTGTWFGEPVFKSNPDLEQWITPVHTDLYAHTRTGDMKRHIRERFTHP